ncbi:MAG: fumarylacetoacetate hydrolase family protein [Actinobacteria bacterium]|nr:MAG: fumarylacetoacetate hydrolase family protein [Actinomycetota bacterium]
MKLVTLRTEDGARAGRLDGDRVELLPFPDVGALLAQTDWGAVVEQNRGEEIAAADVDFAPVVPKPNKIICLGLNYKAHIEEMGRELPSHPTLFAKYAVSLIGARDPIVLPPESQAVDWEVELAFVIGARARRVKAADAAKVVAGFTVFNDIYMRDWQMRTLQFLQGKTFEKSTPVGPAVVTLDEVPQGIDADLAISCEVDGEQMQKARTSDLLFPPTVLVEYISTIMTLEPGDIIATGTPNGVGAGRNPPVFLKPGQSVRTTIEGVGELVNPTVAEAV